MDSGFRSPSDVHVFDSNGKRFHIRKGRTSGGRTWFSVALVIGGVEETLGTFGEDVKTFRRERLFVTSKRSDAAALLEHVMKEWQ